MRFERTVRYVPEADISVKILDIRFVPEADIGVKILDICFVPNSDLGNQVAGTEITGIESWSRYLRVVEFHAQRRRSVPSVRASST